MKTLNDSHLMPYQVEGRDRIVKQDVIYLGDDPGLGKTAQVIRACAKMPLSVIERGVVIVCPASLRVNWASEWLKWDGPECELHIMSYQEAVNDCQGKNPKKGKARVGLLDRTWGVVAFDECHALKTCGGKTKRAKSGLIYNIWIEKTPDPELPDKWHRVDGISALKTVMMSGTPILNKPSDLFSVLRHMDPSTWGSKTKFESRYCNGHMGKWGWDATGASNLGELKQRLVGSGIMLRRLKNDVLTQLPAKRRQLLQVEGTSKTTKACDSLMQSALDSAILSDQLGDMSGQIEDMGDFELLPQSHIAQIRRELGLAKLQPTIDYLVEQEGLGVLPPKLVLFAHHREVIQEITLKLNMAGIKSEMYYGGMNDTQKNQVVTNFMTGDTQVFVGSIVAAGVGLTLTSADTCIILEPSYVPAENIQAEDRIHRIGAQKPVLIQYITLANSLDSRIMDIIIDKMGMIQQVMS